MGLNWILQGVMPMDEPSVWLTSKSMPIHNMRGIVVYSSWLTLTEEHWTLPRCLGLSSQLIPLFSYEGKTSKTAYSKRGFWPLLKTLILGLQKNVLREPHIELTSNFQNTFPTSFSTDITWQFLISYSKLILWGEQFDFENRRLLLTSLFRLWG